MQKTRCPWVNLDNPLYVEYHDTEWGVPVHDDRVFFEFLTLEGAQAGLSWETILKRRATYRQAFANWDPVKVAQFTDQDVERLLQDPGVIRHQGKIRSTISNARVFLQIQQEFGSFDTYIWQFANNKPLVFRPTHLNEYHTTCDQGIALSKDLRKRGMSFVGPTIVYALMQATGLVDEHATSCFKASH